MSVVELKSRIVKKIRTISDKRILAELNMALRGMKAYESKDFWDELTSAQRKTIEVSRKQIDEGKVIPHEQLQQEVKGWLKK